MQPCLTVIIRRGHHQRLRWTVPSSSSSSFSTPPPRIHGLLPSLDTPRTPRPDNIPRPRAHNVLDAALRPQQQRQPLRPGLSREEAARVRVEPLVDDALPVARRLHLAQRRLRVVRVRARGDAGAVAQHVGAGLPRREEDLLPETLAGPGVDLVGEGVRRPLGGRGRVEAFSGRGEQGVEALRYRVVDGGAGQPQEGWTGIVLAGERSWVHSLCWKLTSQCAG